MNWTRVFLRTQRERRSWWERATGRPSRKTRAREADELMAATEYFAEAQVSRWV